MTNHLPLLRIPLPKHEEINARLKPWLLSMANETLDRVSNQPEGKPLFRQKWLSHTELHLSDNREIERLREFIETSANQYLKQDNEQVTLSVFSMWSIISKPGMKGVPHDHTGYVSCAYYVDIGSVGEKDGGLLYFYLNGGNEAPTHTVSPKAGHLYLFPSSLHHSVGCYQGTEPRIVVSANLR